MVDVGLTPVLHQHTGTCIETREETYAVMEAVDTRYLKFGPDIGQLQKGGSDPVQVVKDFLPIIHHMHLKDFFGGEPFLGYSPLGQGKVNIPAILAMMNGKQIDGMVMVELDSSPEHADAGDRDGEDRKRVSAEAGRGVEDLGLIGLSGKRSHEHERERSPDGLHCCDRDAARTCTVESHDLD